MCSPAAFAIGTQLGAGAMNAKAAADQANADVASLGMQRDLELAKAADARQRGAAEEGRTRMAGSRAIGEAKTAITASNIETSSGSAANALADIRMFSELDALTVRSNAAREAWGHEAQAAILEQSRKAKKKQGRNAVLGSFLGTAAGLGKLATAGG